MSDEEILLLGIGAAMLLGKSKKAQEAPAKEPKNADDVGESTADIVEGVVADFGPHSGLFDDNGGPSQGGEIGDFGEISPSGDVG